MKIYGKMFFQYVFLAERGGALEDKEKTLLPHNYQHVANCETVINLKAKHRDFLIFSSRNRNVDCQEARCAVADKGRSAAYTEVPSKHTNGLHVTTMNTLALTLSVSLAY